MRRLDFDTLVIGAGPAGLAAATSAAGAGLKVGLVDDNTAAGGQIWRSGVGSQPNSAAKPLLDDLAREHIDIIKQTRVVAAPATGVLLAEAPDGAVELGYKKLILATGARELFLPFPGWTLPGVMGAGGLQALVKGGLPIKGTRVVVAGSGPLLLAVAAHLKQEGANVLLVAEQAPLRRLIPFGLGLLQQPARLRQGGGLGWHLRGTPYYSGAWITAAHGSGKLQAVTLRRGDKLQKIACDYLACGFGLVPNIELATMLGCKTRNGAVRVDRLQQTSVPGVYCAGEATGIGGVDLSLIEGRIAGLAATNQPELASALLPVRVGARRFARILNRSFALRDELRQLPEADTIVCRCEDVRFAALQAYTTARGAKLQTRCGMGPCQGRVCGAATNFLFNWTPDPGRPPISPTSLSTLASAGNQEPSAG